MLAIALKIPVSLNGFTITSFRTRLMEYSESFTREILPAFLARKKKV